MLICVTFAEQILKIQAIMNDYTKVAFKVTPVNEAVTDILAAMLAEVGYETFVPEEQGLSAYIQQSLFSSSAFQSSPSICSTA